MSDDKKYTDINEIDDTELEEIEEDEDEYEEICMMCHRPESKAGRMLHMPGNVCLCDDCMHRTMDIMNDMQESGILDSPEFQQQMAEFERQMFGKSVTDFSKLGNPFQQIPPAPAKGEKKAPVKEASKAAEEEGVEAEDTEEEGQNIPKGFPQIRFINMNDLQGRGMSDKQKLKKKKKKSEPPIQLKDIPAPHKIKAGLDEYVVGQEKAKKAISVAVYNHYKRIATGTQDSIEIEKSNMLMIGPTGSGKTYLVKTLARLLDVPLAIADATSLTEAGYIGDDIESVVSKLLAAADNDVEKAERGIIFIDEIDKIAKKKDTHARDVSGESVQQGMLKLLEGAEIEVPVGANSKNAMVPLATVNTKNILFICGGAFDGLDKIIQRRMGEKVIGFNSEQKNAKVDEKALLTLVQPEDLLKFGLIPEFIGRLPVIVTLESLTEDALVSIITEPKNALLKQYRKLFAMDGVELSCKKNPSRGYFFIIRKDGTADFVAHPPASITNEVAYAMYGNGFVLRGGEYGFPADNPKFTGLEPRMAFGLTADRKTLVILAVDGRQPGYSLGASYADLAEIFKREGCTDALNLDGGGSTSFVVFDEKSGRPEMLNRHPDGYVRKIALNFGITADGDRDRLELERTASIFHSYEFAPVEDTPPPEGFKPFYISHYGRHGSRRLMGKDAADALAELDKADAENLLTGEGRELRDAVRRIAEASAGMEGQLTERGAAEQRRLARRMVGRFPAVFGGRRRVRCQATDVHRVLASQANFAMALKESAPGMDFDFSTGPKYTEKLKHRYRRANNVPGGACERKEKYDRVMINPEGFVSRMFASPEAVKDPLSSIRRLFACASDCQCLRTELGGRDIYRFFTADEIAALACAMNAWHYIAQRNSLEFGDDRAWAARLLACDFVERADNAIADDRIAADLRFGHDTGLGPLVCLLRLDGAADRIAPEDAWKASPGWKWMPMAANLQMIFYRDKGGDVIVKLLYNERETLVHGLEPFFGPYYRWHDLKERMIEQ